MLQEVPDTVVIAYIGRSNGAGPVLSALSTTPVITVPASVKDFPEDVWSSLRAPSATPVMTVLEPSNAVLAALQILSARNPRLYAHVRGEIENRTVNASITMRRLCSAEAARMGQAALSLLAEIERLKAEHRAAQRNIAELEARADVDPLLDILNRRGFERELKRSLAYLQRYKGEAALLFIDLDGFKAVNDRTAMPPATPCSRRWRASSAGHVRASDVVARLGGDEFGVLLWNLGEAAGGGQGARAGKSDRRRSRGPRRGAAFGRRQRRLVPLDAAATPAQMIDAADQAMYARKKERRG